jgi:hypothetical protein
METFRPRDEKSIGHLSLRNHGIPDTILREFRFLDLDALIASKRAAGRERDLAAIRYYLLAIKERNQPR